MKAFTFRAQVALDLRRRQDELAQRALGVAKAATADATLAVATASTEVTEALQRASEAESTACAVDLQWWHRNWIKSRRLLVERHRSVLERRQVEERTATARAVETRRRLRALEQLRERAWRAYCQRAAREEQRELDLFGSLQFAARRIASRGG